MAASEGVDLEWNIVYLALMRLGYTPEQIVKRDKKLTAYSDKIQKQAASAVDILFKTQTNIKNVFHSDERKIYAKPEPKTDIVVVTGSGEHFVSVKMDGPIQLASGQGASTAEMLKATADHLGRKGEKLKKLISLIEKMPTRLLSNSNQARIQQSNKPKLINEFMKDNSILPDKHYETWVATAKAEIMDSLNSYISEDREFLHAMIYEAMSGEKSLAKYKDAAATHILSPKLYKKIDDAYVTHMLPKLNIDIRGKSRSGITGVAFRIETRGSLQ